MADPDTRVGRANLMFPSISRLFFVGGGSLYPNLETMAGFCPLWISHWLSKKNFRFLHVYNIQIYYTCIYTKTVQPNISPPVVMSVDRPTLERRVDQRG